MKTLIVRSLLIAALCTAVATVGPKAWAQDKAALPDARSQAEAQKLIREVYGDLLDARTDDDRIAAARLLIMRAGESDSAPAAKYVLYDSARSLAVEAGDTATAMEAIEGLLTSFEDAEGFLDVASASLQSLTRGARNDADHAEVAQGGIAIADYMIAAQRQDDALDLLTKLRNSALRARRPELTNAYKAMLEDLRVIRDEARRVAKDLEAIEKDPNDPALNLSVGKYLAVYKGDWAEGLKMLAKSSDETLSALAATDLAGANDSAAQIALGDRWWALAAKAKRAEARGLEQRAGYWYRQALPTSAGIERAVLIKRLSPPEEVTWGDLVLKPGIRTALQPDDDVANAKPGELATQSQWQFRRKPPGTDNLFTLHFEGYLYFPQTTTVGIKTVSTACSVALEVNGKPVLRGNAQTATFVTLIKGYNAINGSILVPAKNIDNPDLVPVFELTLTDEQGKAIPIPAESWFHDATR
jgi:hypothetical protein